jgi:hypothetical protein
VLEEQNNSRARPTHAGSSSQESGALCCQQHYGALGCQQQAHGRMAK